MTLRVVVMNDTSTRYHHGCARVMLLLTEGLERHGATITARSAARNDWAQDSALLAAMRDADLIVINGEGTIHHGKPAGEALLRIADHPARGDTPLALVNALYEDNPPEWGHYLSRFTLLSARDSQSAAQMAADSGADVRWLPDLSVSAPSEDPAADRQGVIVGDSVKLDKRRVLARLACRIPGAVFIPTKTLRGRIWRLPLIGAVARGLLFRLYNAVFPLRAPRFEMPLTEAAYLERLAGAELHITGRFHAVCLSMLTETPFLALTSNASKIEKLLTDAGLETDRIVSAQDLDPPPTQRAFSEDELQKIRAFRALAQERADALFADLLALARAHKEDAAQRPSTSETPRPDR